MEGAIRRERMVVKIANNFAEEHQLDARSRAIVMGAARIGVIEAVRGCMYMGGVSPSLRLRMELYWGFEGIRR